MVATTSLEATGMTVTDGLSDVPAWLVLAVTGARQHGSNDGYDDQPEAWYSWDSTVPNHAAVRSGHLIAVWNKTFLLGASIVDEVIVGEDEKLRYQCPECGKASFKSRQRDKPRFLCFMCGATFDQPSRLRSTVTTYKSHHERSWVEAQGLLQAPALRSLCRSPRSQHSIRRLREYAFLEALESVASGALKRLGALHPMLASPVNGGHVRRLARVRLGQGSFRARLLEQYGESCAFTGPAPAAAIEAAHLYSYAQAGVHEDGGGLLLRRDLHRLFDQGEIAIEPQTGCIDVRPNLRVFAAYADLHGRSIQVTLGSKQRVWVREHWELHRGSSSSS
ncbi:HNH endonuclease [Geodermatophilus sp. SYSU D00696]